MAMDTEITIQKLELLHPRALKYEAAKLISNIIPSYVQILNAEESRNLNTLLTN